MIRVFILVMGLLAASATKAQEIDVSIDFAMLENLVAIFESGQLKDADFDRLLAGRGTKGLIKKMQTFFPEANSDALKSSLRSALGNAQVDDVFMYHRVMKKIPDAKAFMRALKSRESHVESEVVRALSGFLPEGRVFKVKVFVVFGAIGGGWTFDDENNSFYVDASLFSSNDLLGFQYLCAHEIMHLIQDELRDDVDQDNAVNYFLEQAFREGVASYVADFSKIENATGYALFNQKLYAANMVRMESNYKLIQLLIGGLRDGSISYGDADKIALSGMYDSPAYFVFYDMISTLERLIGREKTLVRLDDTAVGFLSYYHKQASVKKDAGLHQFGQSTLELLGE